MDRKGQQVLLADEETFAFMKKKISDCDFQRACSRNSISPTLCSNENPNNGALLWHINPIKQRNRLLAD